jgi:hypothetical protein
MTKAIVLSADTFFPRANMVALRKDSLLKLPFEEVSIPHPGHNARRFSFQLSAEAIKYGGHAASVMLCVFNTDKWDNVRPCWT